MKKKLPTKAASSKSTRRTAAPRKKTSAGTPTIVFHRIVIVSACLTLFVVGTIAANRHTVMRSVAGASIMRGAFAQATVVVPYDMTNAKSYTIYYKESGSKEFTNAVRNISPSVTSYTISYLKKGASYEYQIAAVDDTGKEYFFSNILPLSDLQSM